MKPVSQAVRVAVIGVLADYGRAPQTTASVAARLYYAPGHIRWVLHELAVAGDVVQEGGTGQVVLWSLPGTPVETKWCGRCRRDRPVTEFYLYRRTGKPHAGCKQCRRRQSRQGYVPRITRDAAA